MALDVVAVLLLAVTLILMIEAATLYGTRICQRWRKR